ncbi:MAG: hypothetical protein JWO58_2991 [Chitinophagaceae bacterium]|nr:hypothetical protein [Chitinophagaceae bacterium]
MKINIPYRANNNKRRLRLTLLLSLLLLYGYGGFAQQDEMATTTQRQASLDLLKQKLKTDSSRIYRFQKLRPFVALDNRYTSIQAAPITIHGFQAGVKFSNRHILCLGYYTLFRESRREFIRKSTGEASNRLEDLRMNYVTLFYQYTLIDHRFFRISVPMELGVGQYEIKISSAATGNKISDHKNVMFPVGTGIQVVLKPVRWIGLSSALGYRYVMDVDPNLNFNGWYYAYGVWLDVRQIVRDTRFYLIKKPKYKKAVNRIKSME